MMSSHRLRNQKYYYKSLTWDDNGEYIAGGNWLCGEVPQWGYDSWEFDQVGLRDMEKINEKSILHINHWRTEGVHLEGRF